MTTENKASMDAQIDARFGNDKDPWFQDLPDNDKQTVRNEQMLAQARARAVPKQEVDVANMSDIQLNDFMRKNGFLR